MEMVSISDVNYVSHRMISPDLYKEHVEHPFERLSMIKPVYDQGIVMLHMEHLMILNYKN